MGLPETEVSKEKDAFVIKDIQTLENVRTMFLLIVRIQIPSDAILHPRRTKPSDTLLQNNQNFKTYIYIYILKY
jgi:hypothetical protein